MFPWSMECISLYSKEVSTVTTWILVSDTSRAKLFSAELRDDVWSLVQEIEHPEGRRLSREISPSSPPGRMQNSKASGGRRTAVVPHTSPKEAEAQHFAEYLCHYLKEENAKGRFHQLVLVAPPHFLGMLRHSLDRQTTNRLRTTVEKDLSMFDAPELRQRLVENVFPLTPASP